MKYKFSQVTKKSVSLLLAILMMFSMLTIGITTTSAATNGVFTKDETIYFDFSAVMNKRVNVNNTNFNNKWDFSSQDLQALPNGILETTVKTDTVDLSSSSDTLLFRSEYTNYKNIVAKNASNTWQSGNNMIVVAAGGESFAWSTYGQTTPTKYTVTIANDISNGTVELNPTGTTTFSEGETVTLNVVPNANFQISTLTYTPENGTAINITGTDGAYSFQMPAANVTINATFTATSTPTLSELYFYQNTGGPNDDQRIFTLMDSNNGKFKITTDFSRPNTGNKFKLVSSNVKGLTDASGNNVEDSANYSVSKRDGFDASKVSFSDSLVTANAKVTFDGYDNIVFDRGSSTATSFVIEYTPAGDTGLDGTIKIWTEAEYEPQPSTPSLTLSPTTATLTVGDTLQLNATHSNCSGTVTYSSNAEAVATVSNTGLITAVSEGTATITATCSNGETATCAVTVSAPTLATPKIKAAAFVYPGSEVTVALDNQKDFGTANSAKKYINSNGISFAYNVTSSSGTVTTTPASTGKLLQNDETTKINDSITFTASNTEGVTYTVKVTASANGYTSATSSEITIKVSKIPFKATDRIYAYAGAIAAGATPKLNAWVAAEEKTGTKLDVYSNRENASGVVANYPSLGSSDVNDLRIFLPSTVKGDTVALYNNYSSDLVVKDGSNNGDGTTITPKTYSNVTFTDGTALNITIGTTNKTLTIYKSDAQGAVYLNNTGTGTIGKGTQNVKYADVDTDGVPNMLKYLAEGKDYSLEDNNSGAVADSTGIKDVAVKKIKGRGNTTWSYTDKKSFNVSYSSAVSVGGVTSKKFSFLANYKDPSLSRNKILYALGDKMKIPYSPNVATVDLYMNGLYMGSYLACEKIDVGSNTLISDITELDVKNATEDGVKKGFDFVMELDTSPADDDYSIDLQNGRYLTMKTPEYIAKDLDTAYEPAVDAAIKAYIKGKYDKLESALKGTDKKALEEIIDIDSLANFYLLNELAKNCDIGVASTYFTFKNGKFYASPVWDLDMTVANGDKNNPKNTDNYVSYEGNWTNSNNDINVIMRAAFNNPYVQSAARKLWVDNYYATITGYINELGTLALEPDKSLRNNFTKWTYPTGFNGGFGDNIQFRTSLETASYDVTNHTYTKSNSATPYAENYTGQINFIVDWLKSRAAWMTNKYGTYTVGGLKSWSSDSADKVKMTNTGNGIHVLEITGAVTAQYGIKIYSDANITNGLDTPQNNHGACINYDTTLTVNDKTEKGTIKSATGNDMNMEFNVTDSATAEAPVYLIYNQRTNTVTLSDTESTNTNPIVTLTGDEVPNANIVKDTPVTLTAKVKPATDSGAVVTGDYTVSLYRGATFVEGKTVTFAGSDTVNTEKQVQFTTTLASSNDTYTVKVDKTVDTVTYRATSSPVTYKQAGLPSNKIYFDPSSAWKASIAKDSTVTVTVKDSSGNTLKEFTMIIDPDDVHALAKGVFRGMVDDDTLKLLQSPSNTVKFELKVDDTTLTYPPADSDIKVYGSSSVKDGSIYTYTTESGKPSMWADYNVSYAEEYPRSNITTYQQFVDYLNAQKNNNTDNIVYFDNSVSKWNNVYIYGWNNTGMANDTKVMKKLPYADIWYYDFGTTKPTSEFLFKDRSGTTFGVDYQETVDLVGKNTDAAGNYVFNGNGEKVLLNFENTINTPNPIFVTANFYNCTTKGATGIDGSNTNNILKYRAFNTEWKEFAVIIDSQVRTKAVDVYFDLHSNTAKDIQLYHTAKRMDADGDGKNDYEFASKFTRLNPLPGSNIYYASILLPYTTPNGVVTPAFKFTQFIVNKEGTENDKTYSMSQNVQPEGTCITTGEVWYEVDSTVTPNTTPVASSAKKLSSGKSRISSGANVSILPSGWELSNCTFYFKKPDSWSNVRLAIGTGTDQGNKTSRKMIAPSQILNGNIYKFEEVTWAHCDGFFFIDVNWSCDAEIGSDKNYWNWHDESSHVTDKIQGQDSGYYYELVSGEYGAVRSAINSYYLIGDITSDNSGNKWTVNNKTTPVNTPTSTLGVYSYNVDLESDTNFKISDGTAQYGSPGGGDKTLVKGETYTTSKSDGIGTALRIAKGSYTIYVDQNEDPPVVWYTDKVASVTNPTISTFTADNETIYLSGNTASTNLNIEVNSDANVSNVYYTITKGNSTVTDSNIAKVEKTANGATFTATQTGTYVVTANHDCATPQTVTINVGSTTTIYVKSDLKLNNGNAISNIWTWGDDSSGTKYTGTDWPGNPLTNPVDGYYKVEFNSTNTGNFMIILSNDGNQTGDSISYSLGGTYKLDSIVDNKPVLTPYSVTPAEITSFTTDKSVIVLDEGTANLTIASTDNANVTYTIKDSNDADITGTNIAKVEVNDTDNSKAIFTATQAGTYTVTANLEGAVSKSVTITVKEYKVTLDKTTLNLDKNGSAVLTATPTGFTGATVEWTSSANEVATVDSSGNVTAVGVGNAIITVTYTENDITRTATCSVTVSDNSSSTTTDHCGILGYNHVTATFDATNGGTIDAAKTGVTLKGGYHSDDAKTSGYLTGYKTNDGDVITVIYALVDKTIVGQNASVTFNSITSHTGEGTGEGDFKFAGWEKNGVAFEQTSKSKTLSDGVSTVAPVSYVANWSKVPVYTYTFTYKYDDYNVQNNGIEYKDKVTDSNNYYVEKTYTVKVNSTIASTNTEEVKALYIKHAPKLASVYFDYSFDDPTGFDIPENTTTATGKATNTVKTYSVLLKDASGLVIENKAAYGIKDNYYYQNIVNLTYPGTVETGKIIAWTEADTGKVLGYGSNYQFRITKNITIICDVIQTKDVETNRTIVNTPTYEFYTDNNNQQRVRFKYLVENYVDNPTNVTEYGVLYFVTNSVGKPASDQISNDNNISEETLKAAVNGNVSGIYKSVVTREEMNKDLKYIFNTTIANTGANIDKYLRVYSYFKKIDENGEEVIIVSDEDSCILGSLSFALNSIT